MRRLGVQVSLPALQQKLFWDRSSNWTERQLVTLEAVGSNPIGPATNLWYLGEVAKHIGLSNRHSRVRISQVSLLENDEKRFQEIDFDGLEPLPYALFTSPLRSQWRAELG